MESQIADQRAECEKLTESRDECLRQLQQQRDSFKERADTLMFDADRLNQLHRGIEELSKKQNEQNEMVQKLEKEDKERADKIGR